MIHRPGIEVVSVVSLASSNGLWSFLRETVRSVAVVADRLRVCGMEERESGRVERSVGFRGLESSVSRFRPGGSPLGPKTDPHPSCSDSTHIGQYHAFSLFLALCAGSSMSTTNPNTLTNYRNALKSKVTFVHGQASKRVLIYSSCRLGKSLDEIRQEIKEAERLRLKQWSEEREKKLQRKRPLLLPRKHHLGLRPADQLPLRGKLAARTTLQSRCERLIPTRITADRVTAIGQYPQLEPTAREAPHGSTDIFAVDHLPCIKIQRHRSRLHLCFRPFRHLQ
jgi:hypothetical protein